MIVPIAMEEKRRPSLDTAGAGRNANTWDLQAVAEMLPPWLHRVLLLGGGFTGSESCWLKCLLVLAGCCNMSFSIGSLWLIGMPVFPDFAAFLVVCNVTVVTCWTIRWSFLKSGILWSLVKDLETGRQVLRDYNAKSRSLLCYVFVESLLMNVPMAHFGIAADVGGRISSLQESSIICIWVGLYLNMLLLQPLTQLNIKAIPMLFVAVYDLLVEDIQHFHHNVDALFTEDSRSAETVINELQHHEHALRMRLASVNNVVGPGLAAVLGVYFAVMCTCTLLAIAALKRGGDELLLAGLYAFIVVVCFAVVVMLLRGTARVGDSWLYVIHDLDTPLICVRSASILGLPIADRLKQQHAGIQISGCAITSETVFSVASNITGGLFLAVLGTVVTSPS